MSDVDQKTITFQSFKRHCKHFKVGEMYEMCTHKKGTICKTEKCPVWWRLGHHK